MAESVPLQLVLQSTDNDEPWVINRKVFDILNNCLLSGSTVAPDDAAKDIDKLFPFNRPREGDAENEEPESFSRCGNRLVEVVRSLRDLPDPQTIGFEDWGEMKVWSGLPLLGLAMTEHTYDIDLEDHSDLQKNIRIRQQNFVAFAGRLTQNGLADQAKHFAIHDFREALEEEPDARSKAYLQQGPRLDTYVPLAAIWMLLSGHVIFSHCHMAGEGNHPGGRNWKGEKGYSKERWNFWKKFREIKVHDQGDENTKVLASQAEEIMNQVEAEASTKTEGGYDMIGGN